MAYESDYKIRFLPDPDWIDFGICHTAEVYVEYHILIYPDGTIKVGRPLHLRGAHCSANGMNGRAIGVCCVGNYQEDDPTEEMLKALEFVLFELCDMFNMVPYTCIQSHQTIEQRSGRKNPTLCPGKNLIHRLEEVKDKVGYHIAERWYL